MAHEWDPVLQARNNWLHSVSQSHSVHVRDQLHLDGPTTTPQSWGWTPGQTCIISRPSISAPTALMSVFTKYCLTQFTVFQGNL